MIQSTLLVSLVLLFLGSSSCFAFLTKEQSDHTCHRRETRLFDGRSTSTDSFTRKEEQIDLATGVSMQVITYLPVKQDLSKPPLVFLHGSFHGSWCWDSYYLPYFASIGYPSVAISWRGTGGTFAGEGVKKVKIAEHESDLRALLQQLPELVQRKADDAKPVLISHSFGGLAVMKHLEWRPESAQDLKGIVNFSVVPPSGNGRMTMRYLKRSLIDSWKVTAGLAMKRCYKNAELCKTLFFSVGEESTVTDTEVQEYMNNFQRDSKATIDLMDLAKQLPSAVVDDRGQAPFVDQLPPVLVVGANYDFIVDREGVEETARYYNSEAVYIDSPHDVMLGSRWMEGARVLQDWLGKHGR